MELKHIDLSCLSVSPANMRVKGKTPDLANILPSVRARGVLVPLIVRANGSPETYEIVAGKRRYYSALAVAEETGEAEPLPCAVIAAGDDAAALEASLIENIARLDPDEVTRWETFTRLVREGRRPEDIASTFGLTDLQVRRTLALGNLLPRIRGLYRRGEIDAATVRHLTLASKGKQREWLALFDDETAYCPTGSQLKAWAFGGASIPVSAAQFDLADYTGEIVSDLFGDERYFANAETFWAAQIAAIDARTQAYRDAGWSEVVVLPTGTAFQTWEYERRTEAKGGRVYISVGQRGDVAVYEGYVTVKEARREAKGEALTERPARPETSAILNDYIDLHRHAAIRAKLADAPGVALRVAVAQLIAGSALWSVRVASQRAGTDVVTESVEISPSEGRFDAKRRAILAMLAFDPETPTVTGGNGYDEGLTQLFVKLSTLSDADVLAVLAIVVGETLDPRSDIVDVLGLHLCVDMAAVWQADAAFVDALRDREVLLAMIGEVAGPAVADANVKEPVKTLRMILRDCVDGTGGRAKAEGWVPRWLTFPATAYTGRGGVGSVARSARAVAALTPLAEQESSEPQPEDAEPLSIGDTDAEPVAAISAAA